MQGRILLVEDEENLARMVELELQYENYTVEKAFDGKTGLDRARSGDFDLVLLDIMLPVMSGIEVLRRLRRETTIPVIMLTARDTVVDKVTGLDMGADDYITKPFAIEELLARIRAALRKREGAPGDVAANVLTAGPLQMDTERYEVTVRDTRVELTRREFDLLRYLLEHKEKVVSRETLLDQVWGFDFAGETNAVDVYIRFLRAKIDDHFACKLIHTVRGVGYVIKEGQPPAAG
ncbi:MAG: response regulator transcription factor [Oscillospiraceae bacterium]|nr:response regulator transcription factor [Oscillospiraceae bacterium]